MSPGLTLFLSVVGGAFLIWWLLKGVWMVWGFVVCSAVQPDWKIHEERLQSLESSAKRIRQDHNDLGETVRQMRPLPPEFRKAKRR